MYLQCMRGGSRSLIAVFVTYCPGGDNCKEVSEFLKKIDSVQQDSGDDMVKLDRGIRDLIALNNDENSTKPS